ncbi:MAG: cation transporter, partial [Acidimicrobiia bacterium]|nr:cation transporter [Acidimicrobiia bacterium]
MPTVETPAELTFEVDGMTCAACAVRIERVLGKQDGVAGAVVNFAGAEAKVQVAPGAPTDALRAAVQKIGYDIRFRAPEDERRDLVKVYSDEEKTQWRRFWGSAALALPVMVLAMFGPMHAEWSRILQGALTAPV